MAAKKIGLTATLRFMGKSAVSGMRKASSSFLSMAQSAKRAKAGMSDISGGMQQVGRAGLAVAGVSAFAIKRLTDFEGAFGALKSVIGKKGVGGDLKLTSQAFTELREKAQQLGESTQFTATQAASAMENLARAGFKPKQILTAIVPVLNAAAAEGIDLATAADIASKNMKAFGLTAKAIPGIVDTLAFVSRNTNSNMIGLQEGLKLTASSSKTLGISFSETTKVLGILNNVGLTGTMAGTALNNALIKMSKATKKGVIPIMGNLSAKLEKNKDGSINLTQTMFGVVTALNQTKDKTARLNAAMKIFGIRGGKAALAFGTLLKDGKLVNKLFGKGVKKAIAGTAKEMADMRIDNLHGDFIKLSSAADGLAQSFAATFSGGTRAGLQGITGLMSQASAAFKAFAKTPKLLKGGIVTIKDMKGNTKQLNTTVVETVRGIVLGIQDVKKVLSEVGKSVVSFGKKFGLFGKGGAKESARLVTKVLGLAVALGVVGAGLKVTTTLFGGFARAGVGAAKLVLAAMGPLAKMTGGIFATISKKFPLLAGGAKKIPTALGKGFKFLENLTAMPVRVVNLPLGGLAGVPVPGGGGSLRTGLNGLAASVPLFGAALTTGITKAGLMSGGFLKVAGRLGGFGLAIGAAGVVGWKFGQFLDKTLGLSDKISGGMLSVWNKIRGVDTSGKASEKRFALGSGRSEVSNLVNVLRGGKSKSVRFRGSNKRQIITRELAERRARLALTQKGITGSAQNTEIANLKELLLKLPKADEVKLSNAEVLREAKRGFKVTINLDGKVLATSTAKNKQESKQRGSKGVSNRSIAAGRAG